MPKRMESVRIEDIVVPEDYNLHTVGITQSLLGAYQICRQRFLLAINRWEPLEQSKHVVFGNLFHELLERTYKRGKAAPSFTASAWIKEHVAKNRMRMTALNEEEIEVMLLVAQVVYEEYFRIYHADFKKMDFAGLEKLFAVQFNGFLLRGKKDGKFDNSKGKRWILEHKTKGRIVEEDLKYMLNFDLQNLYYLTAEEIEERVAVYGALYNIIRTPQHKPKKGETAKQFQERLRSVIREDPAHFFIRYEVPYTVKDKARFRKELLAKLQEVEGFLAGRVALFRNENACTLPYRCKYLRLCAQGHTAGYFQKDVLFSELAEEEVNE